MSKQVKAFFRLLKRPLFWVILVPLAIISCAPIGADFESNFDHDDTITREYIKAPTDAGDFTLSYLRAGTPGGQRVILVHGTPGDAYGPWKAMLEDVPEGYEYFAVDRPGFGFTKPKKAVTSLVTHAQVLLPLLDVPAGPRPILVGHSYGGPVITALAAHYPQKVGGLIEVASAVDPDLEEVQWVQYLGLVPPFTWMLASPAENANRELIDLEDELRALKPLLANISAPVYVVHGTDDDLVPYANVPFMEKTFVNAATLQVDTIEGGNHFLVWNAIPRIQKAIMSTAAMEASVSQSVGQTANSTAQD